MKRFFLGSFLLAGLLLGSLGITLGMYRIHRPLSDMMNQAAVLSCHGAAAEAEDLTRQVRAAWKKNRAFTAAFADQSPMEEVDLLFGALEGCTGDSPDFEGYCLQLALRIESMYQAHLPSWWNLL